MSLAAFASQVRQASQLGRDAATRDGIVSSYDPNRFAVKVRLQPDDIETGWLPIRVAQAGNGWGVYAAPAIGDLATVEFLEGDDLVGRVSGFLPNDVDQPPAVPSGELWLVHKAGAFIKLLTDGTLHIEAAAGIQSQGPWTHTGTLHTTGMVTSESDITDHTAADGAGGVSMKKHRDAYNAAQYPGVTSGSAKTGTTDHPAT